MTTSGGTAGVVAAGDGQTARAGARALAAGGNAVDAAVAAACAAFVCELPLAGPLGGGVLVTHTADGEEKAMDFFARVPGLGGARPAALDFDHVTVDFGAATQVFHIGRAAAAVPLALPGLVEAHRRWGRLPLTEVVAPAVELGRAGYVLGRGVAFVFALLEPIHRYTPANLALFSDAEGLGRAGSQLANPQMAQVLEDVAARTDRLLDLYAQLAGAFGPAQGGLITPADVGRLEVEVRAPVRVRHRDWLLSTMPAPSTGGALVALGLKLLADADRHAFLSPGHVEALALAQRLLLSVRDDAFDLEVRQPGFVEALLSDARVAALRAASPVEHPQNPLGSTTHISALDDEGGAVAITLTNGEGCGHVLPGTGIQVNNLLGEEDINPRGFHVDPPGMAMATMMAPTIGVSAAGETIALGSGGSNRLRNAIMATLSHLLTHGVAPRDAVEAPRLHLEGGRLAYELPDLPAEAAAVLARHPGAAPFAARNMFFGGVHLATHVGGRFGGAGDPRRGGHIERVD